MTVTLSNELDLAVRRSAISGTCRSIDPCNKRLRGISKSSRNAR